MIVDVVIVCACRDKLPALCVSGGPHRSRKRLPRKNDTSWKFLFEHHPGKPFVYVSRFRSIFVLFFRFNSVRFVVFLYFSSFSDSNFECKSDGCVNTCHTQADMLHLRAEMPIEMWSGSKSSFCSEILAFWEIARDVPQFPPCIHTCTCSACMHALPPQTIIY